MRHFALLLLCVSTLVAAEPVARNASGTVIYPRGADAKSAASDDHDGWSRAPWLVGALLLAAAGTWWFWRSRGSTGGAGHAGRRLAVEETRSLGNRQYLVVATYADKKLLLGVTPGRIKLLCELEADEEGGP
jgi:flagellar protein FliO/FliZ